jgi:hypothetical protein
VCVCVCVCVCECDTPPPPFLSFTSISPARGVFVGSLGALSESFVLYSVGVSGQVGFGLDLFDGRYEIPWDYFLAFWH